MQNRSEVGHLVTGCGQQRKRDKVMLLTGEKDKGQENMFLEKNINISF